MSATNYVTLTDGPTLPLAALRVAWSLEERGFRMALDGCNVLVVEPADQLTDGDVASIQRWRYHLAAIVRYTPPPRVQ